MQDFHNEAFLIANGKGSFSKNHLSQLQRTTCLIAVDGGIQHCQQLGLTPQLIIGDLDSAFPEVLTDYAHVEKKLFPQDKDHTDLELAVEFALQNWAKVRILGGLGGRTDHLLSNINLLALYPGRTSLESADEFLFVIDKCCTLNCYPGQILSLLPLNGPVTGIYTKGLKWELSSGVLDQNFMGISNVCLEDSVNIEVKTGSLLCILQT